MENFIYVFSEENRDLLISQGYELLKEDENNGIYVFINDIISKFSLNEIECVYSNTLTF